MTARIDTDAEKTEYSLVKTITISFFKAHISEELKKVRNGAHLVISDRDNPIAEVVPYSANAKMSANIQPPVREPFLIPESSLRIAHDPLEDLMEDRLSR